MARKSAAELSVVPIGTALHRLSSPPSLTSEEAEVWDAVVSTKPADWFQADSAPVLEEYCKAVVMARFLSYQIEAAKVSSGDEGSDLATFEKLLRLRDMESKRVLAAGTKLRLTQQARYTPQASATADRKAGKTALPWQRSES